MNIKTLLMMGILSIGLVGCVKGHYVATQSSIPKRVDERLQDGWKIVSRYKLINPNPRILTAADLSYIKEHLEEWLQKDYPELSFTSTLQYVSESYLKENLKYEFSLLSYRRILEGDFYAIQLRATNKQEVCVYIAKALSDTEDYSDVETTIIYPYFREVFGESWFKELNKSPISWWEILLDDESLYR